MFRILFTFWRWVWVDSFRFWSGSVGFSLFRLIFGGFGAFPSFFKLKCTKNHHFQLQTSMKRAVRPVSGSQSAFESRRRARNHSRRWFEGVNRVFSIFWVKSAADEPKSSNSEVSETMLVGWDRQKLSKRWKTRLLREGNACLGAFGQIWEKSWILRWSGVVAKMDQKCSKSSSDVFFGQNSRFTLQIASWRGFEPVSASQILSFPWKWRKTLQNQWKPTTVEQKLLEQTKTDRNLPQSTEKRGMIITAIRPKLRNPKNKSRTENCKPKNENLKTSKTENSKIRNPQKLNP